MTVGQILATIAARPLVDCPGAEDAEFAIQRRFGWDALNLGALLRPDPDDPEDDAFDPAAAIGRLL